MRQTGWLCACGIMALSEENISRLREDHRHALSLAQGLSKLPGIRVDMGKVHTNYVLAWIDPPGCSSAALVEALSQKGVMAHAGDKCVRFVTSRQVTQEDINYVVGEVFPHLDIPGD